MVAYGRVVSFHPAAAHEIGSPAWGLRAAACILADLDETELPGTALASEGLTQHRNQIHEHALVDLTAA